MSDEGDIALSYAEKHNAESLARQLAKNEEDGPGSDECIECGDPIEPGRRKARPASRHCTDCAEFQEHVEARRAQGLA